MQKDLKRMVFSPTQEKQNGRRAPSTEAYIRKNTSVTHFCKKPTPQASNNTSVKNNGIVPQYYVDDTNEAIIPKNIFLRVQEEPVRRQVTKTNTNGKKRSYRCNHRFAQIVVCGECGEMFRRIHWTNCGCKSIVRWCCSRLEATGRSMKLFWSRWSWKPPTGCSARRTISCKHCRLTLTEFDETLIKRLIAKIIVFDGHFTLDFKSRLTIDIKA